MRRFAVPSTTGRHLVGATLATLVPTSGVQNLGTLLLANNSAAAAASSSTSSSNNSGAALSEKQQEFLKSFRSRIADADAEGSNSNTADPTNFIRDAAVDYPTPCGIPASAIPLREDGPTSYHSNQAQNINHNGDGGSSGDGDDGVVRSVPMVKRGQEPLPKWLKLSRPQGDGQGRYNKMRRLMRDKKLATVCEQARCPNIGECWGGESSDKSRDHVPTATIMIMGDTCTRACRFCAVKTARIPPPLDPREPERTAKAVASMGVPYIVITMVDRDDQPDSGANHVAEVIKAVKAETPSLLLECLVGDFHGDKDCVSIVANAGLEVYAHNIECVERVTPRVRDRRAAYRQSLQTLEHAKAANPKLLTKTSIMLGVGETEEEVRQTLRDCRNAGIDAVTLGQYLQPSKTRMKVERYVHPSEFDMWKREGDALGFIYTASGPMIRSSFAAGEYYMANVINKRKADDAASSSASASQS